MEAHDHSSEPTKGDTDESYDISQHLPSLEAKEDVEEDQASSDLSFEYEVAERFLFETTAIEALEVSIKGHVASNVEIKGGYEQGLWGLERLRIHFWNFSLMFKKPAIQGTRRISWKCVNTHPLPSFTPGPSPSSLFFCCTYAPCFVFAMSD